MVSDVSNFLLSFHSIGHKLSGAQIFSFYLFSYKILNIKYRDVGLILYLKSRL